MIQTNIHGLVNDLIRILWHAGEYALRVQPLVENLEKEGSGAIKRALTAADLSVEAFFEVFLLAQYPWVRFVGEEFESSRNTSFFDKDASVVVACDPINGTLSYARNRSEYEVILSIFEDGEMVAAMLYGPYMKNMFIAHAGEGAKWLSEDMIMDEAEGKPVSIVPDKEVIWGTVVEPSVRQALDHAGFDVIDYSAISRENDESLDLPTPADMLFGELAAFFRRDAMVIDTVATAFIAKEAGAVVVDYDGNALDFKHAPLDRVPSIICASSQEQAQIIVEALR